MKEPVMLKVQTFALFILLHSTAYRHFGHGLSYNQLQGVPGGSVVRNPPTMQETPVWSLGREDPLEKGMATHSSILAGEFHGQRSLVGYSLWGHKEPDMTEQLTHTLL